MACQALLSLDGLHQLDSWDRLAKEAVRAFCEDLAFIRAVVSLPQETFCSAGASVKASLLFMQKFTNEEKDDYDAKRQAAVDETDAKYQPEIDAETALGDTFGGVTARESE